MECSDVVAILEACKGLGLKALSLGELRLTFHDLTTYSELPNNSTSLVPINASEQGQFIIPEAKEPSDQDDEENLHQNDFAMAYLQAENPELFEEELKKAANARQ